MLIALLGCRSVGSDALCCCSPALLEIRDKIETDRGNLELMLEVLRLAAAKNDISTGIDVLWAILENSLFQQVSLDLKIQL